MKMVSQRVVGVLLIPVLLLAAAARAQEKEREPDYRFSQAGKAMRLTLRVSSDEQGNKITEIRDASSHPGAGPRKVTHSLNMILKSEAASSAQSAPVPVPVSCLIKSGLSGRPDQVLMMQATLVAGGSNPPSYEVRQPASAGTLPFSGTLLTENTLKAFGGSVYDWQRGGRQSFVLLSDSRVLTPTLTTLYLTAEKPEQIELGGSPIKARRLRYEASVPHLTPTETSGVLYIGSSGELLRCDTNLLGRPYKVDAPAVGRGSTGWTGYSVVSTSADSSQVPPLHVVVEKLNGTFITREFYRRDSGERNNIIFRTTSVNRQFSMIRHEADLGRKRTYEVDGNGSRLNYSFEASTPTRQECVSNRPFFFPQWFATEGWERRGGSDDTKPDVTLSIGDKFDIDYFPLLDHNPLGYFATLERRKDVEVTRSGKKTALRYYRVTVWKGRDSSAAGGYYDVYTDGQRLVAALGTDGVRIEREAWEDVTAQLKPPTPPTSPTLVKP